MRKEGKTAYLVLDQLVVRDKVKDRDRDDLNPDEPKIT